MTLPFQQPKFALKDKVDFVIVGSGAAGGVLAKELSSNGFKVVVLEQGPFLTEKDFGHDEYMNFAQGPLVNHRQKQTFRATEQEVATPALAALYGKIVGGGSVHFTANFWRFHEIDFIEASKKEFPPAPEWPIGQSPTPTWNRITPRLIGKSESPDRSVQIPSSLITPSRILCRQCR